MQESRSLVLVAAAVLALVVAAAASLRHPSVSVVIAYLDGSRDVTLVYASCGGRDAVSIGENVYTYVHVRLGSVEGTNLSALVDTFSGALESCRCRGLRGPVPQDAHDAAVASSLPPALGKGFYFWMLRLGNGAFVAVSVLDKLVFNITSVLYIVIALLLLATLGTGMESKREVCNVDLFITLFSIVIAGFALIPVFLYLFFSMSAILLAYLFSETSLLLTIVLIIIIFINIEKINKIIFIILIIIISLSIAAFIVSISDTTKLMQMLSILGVGQSFAGLIGPIVLSLLVGEALRVHEVHEYSELQRLLVITSFVLIVVGVASLAVYEADTFLSFSFLNSWPLLVVLLVLATLPIVLSPKSCGGKDT